VGSGQQLAGGTSLSKTKGESVMFARIVEFIPKAEKKEELIKAVRNEVVPVLKKQPGFLEILPFLPESTTEKTMVVSLWAEKRDAERYEREAYPKVAEIVKPYLTTAITFKHYVVETSVSATFMESFAA
jgi:heme-degrading monooxygenase HmoA